MAFRRARSYHGRERNRPVTPSAEGYLGPEELRDTSRSPIVTAGDDEDEEERAESENSYATDGQPQTSKKKSILKVKNKMSSCLIQTLIHSISIVIRK